MLTHEPDNRYSAYSCNLCGVSSQVLVPVYDEDGNQMQDENWQPIMMNDEPAASAEIAEHMRSEHPETTD